MICTKSIEKAVEGATFATVESTMVVSLSTSLADHFGTMDRLSSELIEKDLENLGILHMGDRLSLLCCLRGDAVHVPNTLANLSKVEFAAALRTMLASIDDIPPHIVSAIVVVLGEHFEGFEQLSLASEDHLMRCGACLSKSERRSNIMSCINEAIGVKRAAVVMAHSTKEAPTSIPVIKGVSSQNEAALLPIQTCKHCTSHFRSRLALRVHESICAVNNIGSIAKPNTSPICDDSPDQYMKAAEVRDELSRGKREVNIQLLTLHEEQRREWMHVFWESSIAMQAKHFWQRATIENKQMESHRYHHREFSELQVLAVEYQWKHIEEWEYIARNAIKASYLKELEEFRKTHNDIVNEFTAAIVLQCCGRRLLAREKVRQRRALTKRSK